MDYFFSRTHTHTHTHTNTNNTKYSILMDLSINNTMYYFPYLFIYYQGIALDI